MEVGCGLGIDFRHFASGQGLKVGLDLSHQSLRLAKQPLEAYGLQEPLVCGDGENLPFENNKFDLVYSWGVIHHSADPPAVVKEIYRVLKPGGRVIAMIYNLRSLFVLQVWLYYGLLRGKPFTPPHQLVHNVESPMTKAYSTEEASLLFRMFDSLKVEPILTPYDLRLGRRIFLPKWLRLIVPSKLGWFITVEGTKPLNSN